MITLHEILKEKLETPVYRIEIDASVLEAVQRMNEYSIGALIVTQHNRLAGIFTERDVLRRVIGKQQDPEVVTVGQVMTRQVICCTPATSIEDARELMRAHRIRHLPILDSEGDVVGVVSIGDLNAHECSRQEMTIQYMTEYLHGRV